MKFGGPKSRFLILAGFVALAAIIAMMTFLSRSPPPSPLPNPNGYDDFLNAASLLAGDPGYYETSTVEELRALISTNAESLRVLRLA